MIAGRVWPFGERARIPTNTKASIATRYMTALLYVWESRPSSVPVVYGARSLGSTLRLGHRQVGLPGRYLSSLSSIVSARHCAAQARQNVIDIHNHKGYIRAMYPVVFHRRRNRAIPFEEYVRSVYYAGQKKDAARIRAFVERLRQEGSQRLVARGWAEKMNDVWQLRAGQHRIFYFWHSEAEHYVVLNGYRKRSRRTPRSELARAESLRAEHLGG